MATVNLTMACPYPNYDDSSEVAIAGFGQPKQHDGDVVRVKAAGRCNNDKTWVAHAEEVGEELIVGGGEGHCPECGNPGYAKDIPTKYENMLVKLV